MSENPFRYPKLDSIYQQYLADENSAEFVDRVASCYTLSTLERLASSGKRISRRAAVMALGFLGNYRNNEIFGRALIDPDRAVRLLADHGIREIWQRQGTPGQQAAVQQLYRLVAQSQMDEVIDLSSELIRENPKLGEVWNQRAIAYCFEGYFEAAIDDCLETLNCNRFHFPAAMGIGHCQLQLEDTVAALDSFRLALKINPDLDGIRHQITQLEKILED
ncbi:MAG: hypothetical protein AAF939_17245 [Planctomycetota bacterium]